MKKKLHKSRWEASINIWTGRVEFQEWVHRSTQNRKVFPQYSWSSVNEYNFWTRKIDGITWVKLSKKQGDYGWAKSIDVLYRKRQKTEHKLPFSATKAGALRQLRKHTVTMRDRWGGCPNAVKTVERAQARLKAKN